MKIGLLSDTHSYLDERIAHHLTGCDEIWHAGDIGNLQVTDKLQEIAPLRAVWGNIDGQDARARFPEHQRFIMEGFTIWMTHITGRPGRYNPAIRTQLAFKAPDILIGGHSHILQVQRDQKYKTLYLNPGAAGRHGFHKKRSLLLFNLENKSIKNMQAVELGPRSSLHE
jgi:putative phosphoesterase